MNRNRCYDMSSKYTDVTSIRKSVETIVNTTNKYDKFDAIETMSIDDIDNIIYRSEKVALSCRSALENINNPILELKNDSFLCENNDYVTIKMEDDLLKISTPFTFKRSYRDNSLKENYIMMNYVKAALKKWENDNRKSIFRLLKSPLIAMIIRKNITFDRTKICDNDNLENGRIINEIMNSLGYSDNAITLSIYSSFKIIHDVNECGMDFIIFPKKDICAHLDLF